MKNMVVNTVTTPLKICFFFSFKYVLLSLFFHIFFRKVLEKLQNIEDLSNVIYEHFQYNLREIYHIVYMKIAIPVNMIFVSHYSLL